MNDNHDHGEGAGSLFGAAIIPLEDLALVEAATATGRMVRDSALEHENPAIREDLWILSLTAGP